MRQEERAGRNAYVRGGASEEEECVRQRRSVAEDAREGE